MVEKTSKYIAHEPDKKGIVHYTYEEQETWRMLYERQVKLIAGRACNEFIEGLKLLNLNADTIAQCHEINKVLEPITGWGIERVPCIIPADEFFGLLAEKRFPAATFIRIREELDYIEEPDIFHETFGHCPLLTIQPYADFMQNYAKIALKVCGKTRMHLFRLFWFTIEFGLIQTQQGKRIYGGGILSSKEETTYALNPNGGAQYAPLDFLTALRTPYKINILQPKYFIINSFNQLYDILDTDLLALVDKAMALGDLPFPGIENQSTMEIHS